MVKTVPSDMEYESIELEEVRRYIQLTLDSLTKKGIVYKQGVFDCEDYTRAAMSYIMINHSYTLAPAICDVHIIGHSLLGFHNNKGALVLIDAQNGRVWEDQEVIDRRY